MDEGEDGDGFIVIEALPFQSFHYQSFGSVVFNFFHCQAGLPWEEREVEGREGGREKGREKVGERNGVEKEIERREGGRRKKNGEEEVPRPL